jgi:carbon-monoxide dehydrogenase medium subunit
MKLRMSEPTALIDIARIPGLSGIRENQGSIEIGAATTHHQVATSALLAKVCPMVCEMAADIGDPQVRNKGTIGGSLAHADPAADYPAVMLALDADIHLQSPRGPRVVKASEFFQGLFTVDLAQDEMIVSVRFIPVKAAAYAKLHQRASHFAIVGVAAALTVEGGKISAAKVGITGAGPHASRLRKIEEKLVGSAATPETAKTVAAGASVDDLNSDIHASEDYRRAMVPVFARRAIEGALARA